ncbi:unnamed protein product [Hymenolepis diminuta]|uniref:Protein kinase domain-containing protein n=1 Tax=Hymenolepis diminuta TaxID=6216 RepID=A0A564YLX3_HYMDI|nr:unnamed protein product [Hymenolepis diminuta]
MKKEDFKIVKVLGSGCYSVTYEVICTKGKFKNRKYAMKRYFLNDEQSICRALIERQFGARLVSRNSSSPFVATLFWAFGGWKTPCCVYTLGSDYTLRDLVKSVGLLKEEDARFYIAEIICGLEYIHEKGVVHRDIKLENVLLSESGHAIIADFDSAYDLEVDHRRKKSSVYAGTLEYMAPEIANRVEVTKKADVWSLGALMAHLVTPRFRSDRVSRDVRIQKAMDGTYEILNAASLSNELMKFFDICLKHDYNERPEVVELKALEFFTSIDWTELGACRMEPPFKISELKFSCISKLAGSSRKLDASKLQFIPKNLENLKKYGYTNEKLQHLFRKFNFVNPLYFGPSTVKE